MKIRAFSCPFVVVALWSSCSKLLLLCEGFRAGGHHHGIGNHHDSSPAWRVRTSSSSSSSVLSSSSLSSSSSPLTRSRNGSILFMSTSSSSSSTKTTSPPPNSSGSSSSSSGGGGSTGSVGSGGNQKEQEKLLRQEVAERNSAVENEERYAIVDGEGMEAVSTATAAEPPRTPSSTSSSSSSSSSPPPVGHQHATTTSSSQQTSPPPATATATTTAEGGGGGGAAVAVTTTIPTRDHEMSPLEAQMERLTKPRAYPLFLAEKLAEFVESTVDDIAETFKTPAADPMMTMINGDSSSSMRGISRTTKEKIVILGTGWGATTYLKEVNTDLYDVTVISPRNYFLFTPMLAGASVGTVEFRSITEGIRSINPNVKFLEATATNIDPSKKTVRCESVVCDGNSCSIEDFHVPYGRLIVAVGAQTNTFGIPGVREHCCFLRQVEDARRVRTALVNCFERANLPTTTTTDGDDEEEEEKRKNLTFAVIGAGPTGIEFAAELRDFIEQDGPKYYPHLLKYVKILVIEASPTVLAPFDKALQEEAIRQLRRRVQISNPDVQRLIPDDFQMTEILLSSSVKEVREASIVLNDGRVLPYGLSVWAAGNGPLPITLQLIEALGEEQSNEQPLARGRLAVDSWMRAVGSDGDILALGDCTYMTRQQLPATAQVASQQGEYLASIMNKGYDLGPARRGGKNILPPPVRMTTTTTTTTTAMTTPSQEEAGRRTISDVIAKFATSSPLMGGGGGDRKEGEGEDYAKAFQFLNLGILAYTGGGSAIADVKPAPGVESIKGKGQLGNAVWRSVYLTKQVSWRNRLLVLNDWTKRQFFGRDITRL